MSKSPYQNGISTILNGKDLVYCGKTGLFILFFFFFFSGILMLNEQASTVPIGADKAALFMIPALTDMFSRPPQQVSDVVSPTVLILEPTYQPGNALFQEFQNFLQFSPFKAFHLSDESELDSKSRCDFLISTPAQLATRVQDGTLTLSHVKLEKFLLPFSASFSKHVSLFITKVPGTR